MGGVKTQFDEEHWNSLPDATKIRTAKDWILIEIEGKRLKSLVLKKETEKMLTDEDKAYLEKRGYNILFMGKDKFTDADIYALPKKTSIKPSQNIDELVKGMNVRYVRKEDYSSMSPEQRKNAYTGNNTVYFFQGSDTPIPESQAIIDKQMEHLERLERLKKRRTHLLPMNKWILEVLIGRGKESGDRD